MKIDTRGNEMTVFRRQNGATLLEVLVAIIVLALGLLGMAGLQAASLRVNQGALQRSQAVLLAYDILDQMRGNPDGADAGNYNVDIDATSANPDVTAWKSKLAVALGPGAKGGICQRNAATWTVPAEPCPGVGTGFFVVEVSWSEADLSTSNAVQSDLTSSSTVTRGRVTHKTAVVGRVR